MKKRLTILFLVLIGSASCQTAKAPTFEPNEVQALRLQNKQKDAQMMQMVLQQAQQQFQQKLKDLNDEADKVKNENKWPSDVAFNADTLKFAPAAKTPEPPAKK